MIQLPGAAPSERGFGVVRAGRVGFAYFMTHTIAADDVTAEVSPKQMLADTLRAHLKGQGQVQ